MPRPRMRKPLSNCGASVSGKMGTAPVPICILYEDAAPKKHAQEGETGVQCKAFKFSSRAEKITFQGQQNAPKCLGTLLNDRKSLVFLSALGNLNCKCLPGAFAFGYCEEGRCSGIGAGPDDLNSGHIPVATRATGNLGLNDVHVVGAAPLFANRAALAYA